jgi:signal transduction histidine kinase/DNA-binding NarL/FixJ family response regulator
MRSVFSAIDDTVILLDSNFAIADQKVNASYKARGFDSSYFERILDHDLGPAKGGVTARAFLKRHLSVDQPQRVLVKQRHGYDKTYYHELTAAVLDASSGTRQGMVVVLRDVTQQETQRERLTHAQQMEAIGRLSSGIAHDFNNLITGIQSAAEFIREDIPEDVHEFLDIIVGSSERAALLTRRLLLHARKSSYDALESLKVDELIRESIGLLQRSLDRRVKLSTVFASPGMLVNADATLLQGIFLNLAINASQAMPEGGLLEFRSRESVLDPTTAAGVHHSLQAGKYAVIEVIDSGNGIPAEIQDKIFEPFFTTKSAGNGTGLGLSTAMDVLRRSGGYMTVKSVEGAGSTFTIYLPVVDGAAPSMERIPSDPTVVPSIDASIMVIDDEPAIRRSISLSLTKLGYHVESFRNGPEALTRLKTEVPDIIVLDMIMPGMSGRQVFDLIQQLPNPPAVIVTTGYAESDDIFSMLQRGLFSVVSKPYKIHEVAAEIERALSNHQSSAALADSMRDVLGASHVEATAVVPRVASQLRA